MCDAEALALAAGDVRAAGAGVFQQAEGERLGERGHGERAARVHGRIRRVHILDHAEEVGRLQGHGRQVVAAGQGAHIGAAVRAEIQFLDRKTGGPQVALDHGPVVRVDGPRHGHPGALAVDAQAHEQGLGERGGAVVHGGVDHVHAEQPGGEGLVLEDTLQGALADLRLVGGVGGEELGAGGQGAHRLRDVVAVGARADQHPGARAGAHGGGETLQVVVELPFAQRRRQMPRPGGPAIRGHRREQRLQRVRADHGEHLGDLFGGVRQVAHGPTPAAGRGRRRRTGAGRTRPRPWAAPR